LNTALRKLRYRCAHRSAEAANYLRGDERVDFLFASRPIARRLLTDAEEHTTLFGILRVISTEGLIGFKMRKAEDKSASGLPALFVSEGGVARNNLRHGKIPVVAISMPIRMLSITREWR
jgi:hypothetical protein